MLDGACLVVPGPGTLNRFAPFVLEAGEMALFGPGIVHGIRATDREIQSVYGGYLLGRRQPPPGLPRLPDFARCPGPTAAKSLTG